MRFGLKGPNFATVSACASSAHAIGESFNLIRYGVADVMVTGGAEAAITGLTVGGFANMKALSARNDSPETACRPFDQDRDGFVLGDGGAIVVLESLEHAEARGARIQGEVLGYGATGDAYHITSPAEHGEGAQRAMQRLPRGRRDRPRTAWTTSTRTAPRRQQGDVAETEAVKAVFGEQAAEARLRLDQVDDRPPARRGRRARVRGLAPGRQLRHHPADDQPVHPRSRVRPRLRAQPQGRAPSRRGAVQLASASAATT